jgi:hypothetical protein
VRVNVYLPDELAEAVRDELPGVNVSGVLQEALRGLLACDHRSMVCTSCAAPVDAERLRTDAVESYYRGLIHELGPVVDNGGTAEGAARVAKRVALDHDVAKAERIALPRPPRNARRRAAEVAEATRLPMSHHPTTMYRRGAI